MTIMINLNRPKRIWEPEDKEQFKLHLLKKFIPTSDKPQKLLIQQTWNNLDAWEHNWHNKQDPSIGENNKQKGCLSFLPRKYLQAFLKLIRHEELIVDPVTGQITGKKKNKNGTCRKRRSNHLHTVKEICKYLVSRMNTNHNHTHLRYLQITSTSIDNIVKALGFSVTAVKKALALLVKCDFLIIKRVKYISNNGLIREAISEKQFTELFFRTFGLGNKIDEDTGKAKKKKKNKLFSAPKKQGSTLSPEDKKKRERESAQSRQILQNIFNGPNHPIKKFA